MSHLKRRDRMCIMRKQSLDSHTLWLDGFHDLAHGLIEVEEAFFERICDWSLYHSCFDEGGVNSGFDYPKSSERQTRVNTENFQGTSPLSMGMSGSSLSSQALQGRRSFLFTFGPFRSIRSQPVPQSRQPLQTIPDILFDFLRFGRSQRASTLKQHFRTG